MAKAKSANDKPAGPKRSKSAYTLFWMEERLRVKEDLPELNNNEIMSEVGKRWKVLAEQDPERLERLQKDAKADQERYKREKEENVSSEVIEEDVVVVEVEAPKTKGKAKGKSVAKVEVVAEPPKEVKKTKGKKAKVEEAAVEEAPVEEAVKKTKVNGYINFAKAKRSEVKASNPSLSPQDVSRELGKLWKALTDSEKAKYTQE